MILPHSTTDTSLLIQPEYMAALYNFQKTLAITTGISLAIADNTGKPIVYFSHPQDRIHEHVIKKLTRLSIKIKEINEDFNLIHSSSGLTFMSSPVVIKKQICGRILAGPVLEAPPTTAQIKILAELMNTNAESVMQAVMLHPAPIPINLERGREMTSSLAEMTVQIMSLQAQQQESLDLMRSLYDISTDISSSLEMSEILPTVVNDCAALLNADSGYITVLDRARQTTQTYVKNGEKNELSQTDKTSFDDEFKEWINTDSNVNSRKTSFETLCVPLLISGQCIGFIRMERRRNGVMYTPHDKQVLGIISGHASSAIDKAQVYAQALRQFRELEALQDVGLSLNSSIDVPKTLRQVLDHACDLLEAENASVMLVEPDGKHLKIHIARGLPAEVIKRTRVKLGERISGRVALYGIPCHLSGKNDKGDIKGASLSVPLKVDNKIIGVLNVRCKGIIKEFTKDDIDLATRLASMSAAAITNAKLHDELQQLHIESITALANSIDARDPYTRGHSERVAEYSVQIGKFLNFSAEELWQIRNAALLHDIGKIRIADKILKKPGGLTDDEYEEMKRHPVYGAGIMMPVKSFRPLITYILHHHEHYDGNGYPDRIRGDDIPLCARIISIADSFDAMTSNRPYRGCINAEIAISELVAKKGSQFDPYLVNIFLKIYREGKLTPILRKISPREPSIDNERPVSPSDNSNIVWGQNLRTKPQADTAIS